MRVLGVIDLMGGVVVHGVGGRRAEYRPVESALCASSDPLPVARAFRREYGLEELYLADLDAIAGAPPAWAIYEELRSDGFALWVDAGVREAARGHELARAGVGVVAGLETVAGAETVETLARELGERMVFSLDLRSGVPLAGWGTGSPPGIAAEAVARGVRKVLVLDLARVGEERGAGTEDLCARLATTYPDVEVWAGGGVRGRADLERLKSAGVRAALAATALHRRRLTRDDLRAAACVTHSAPRQ